MRCKRCLDIVIASIGLLLLGWLILLAAALAWMSSGGSGFFRQERVGRNGKLFRIVKLRTMRMVNGEQTTATALGDPRITRVGALLRATKLDELPQFWNVFWGEMSVVGPRPDVPGFADRLQGKDRNILQLRPGITGLASLVFRHEEELLAAVDDPDQFNSEIIYPAKVSLNLRYLEDYTLRRDFVYILATFVPSLRARVAPAFSAS
ncbi:MAG: sugar transferase [Planctomycetota bacterium]|nr:MAG: sugar transferase [Planctomycetota bacterium]